MNASNTKFLQAGLRRTRLKDYAMYKGSSAFSDKLKRFLYARPVLALLPGYGWMDGGCLILARALLPWVLEGGALGSMIVIGRVLQDGSTTSDHYAVCVGRFPDAVYLDGRGAAEYGVFVTDFIDMELAGCPYQSVYCVPADYACAIQKKSEIPHDDAVSARLNELIHRHFGQFKERWLRPASPPIVGSR